MFIFSHHVYKIVLVIVVIFSLQLNEIAAEMNVYDASDQYLGILIDSASIDHLFDSISIFIPSLNKPVTLYPFESEGDLKGKVGSYGEIVFRTNNCTGTPYLSSESSIIITDIITNHDCTDLILLTNISEKKKITPKSHYIWYSCECVLIESSDIIAIPLQQISLPFDTPVSLPLKIVRTQTSSNKCDVNGDGKTGLEESIHILKTVSDN